MPGDLIPATHVAALRNAPEACRPEPHRLRPRLDARIRAEGAHSAAVVAGLQLTIAAWTPISQADVDEERRWGWAATAARAVLDTLDPLATYRLDPDPAAGDELTLGAAAAFRRPADRDRGRVATC